MDDDWDETARGVGWVAREAARLEFAAAQLEAKLIMSDQAIVVIAGQGWSATRDACRAMLAERIGRGSYRLAAPHVIAVYEELLRTLAAADQLMTKRNHVMHALWWEPDDAGVYETMLVRRWGQWRSDAWNVEDLGRLRADLQAATEAIDQARDFVDEVNDQHLE